MRRSVLLAALLCALVAIDIRAAAVPGCSWNGYDFSSLSALGDWSVVEPGYDQAEHFVRVCGVLAQPACRQADSTSAACRLQQRSAQCDVGGRWLQDGRDVQWSFLDPRSPSLGVQYELDMGGACTATGRYSTFLSRVQFACAPKLADMTLSAWLCDRNYTIPTPLACPSAASPGATLLALD